MLDKEESAENIPSFLKPGDLWIVRAGVTNKEFSYPRQSLNARRVFKRQYKKEKKETMWIQRGIRFLTLLCLSTSLVFLGFGNPVVMSAEPEETEPLTAGSKPTELPPVVVRGEPIAHIPVTTVTQDVEAAPASTMTLHKEDLDRLSITTYGDLFRNVTGVFVNEYGQGLISYEIKMRGFASGHSRDIGFSLDGVPLNVTGSSHTNGYMDLATLIPETVSRVDIVRGPFSVKAGNHAVAGSVYLYTGEEIPSMVKIAIDNWGRTRILPIYSEELGSGHLLLALDGAKGRGYSDSSDIERGSVFARYSLPAGAGRASMRVQYYDAKAEAPGYLNLNRIETGAISARSALSEGNGDKKVQTNVVFNYRSTDADGHTGWGSGWWSSLYYVHDDRRRWFNYDVNTPVGANPDLEAEHDKMDQVGFDVQKATMLGESAQLLLGSQFNNEKVDAMIFTTDSKRISRGDAFVFAQRDLTTRTTAFLGEVQWKPLRPLKVQVGLRWDQINFSNELGSLDPAFGGSAGNSFDDTQSQFSPKLGIAWTAVEGAFPLELFANAARGLKSPYAFGDFNRLSFTSISPLTSHEIGLLGGNRIGSFRASVWRTQQEKEALFNGEGRFIDNQKTNRDGFDVEGRIALASNVGLNGNFSRVFARIDNAAPNDHILSVPEWTAGIGIDATSSTAIGLAEWSLFDTIIGPQPLFPDNSKETLSYHRVVARVAISPSAWRGAKFALSGIYYSRQFEEQQFDAGGGQFGTAPKPTWQALASVQWTF